MSYLSEQANELLRYLVRKLVDVVPGKPETYVSYKLVHDEMGLAKIGSRYGISLQRQGLNELAEWVSINNFPGITGLIIDKAKREPGDGYYRLYDRQIGDTSWWKEQIKNSIQFDWSRCFIVDTKVAFENWLIQIGKSEKTAKNYSGAISGSLTKWSIDNIITDISLTEITEARKVIDIALKLNEVEIFKIRNSKGGNMYSCALKMFAEYLRDKSNKRIDFDINEIISNTEIEETVKSRFVSARIGQGRYRQQLIEIWKGCSLTGYLDARFLVASHIKPWRESVNKERLDPYNGFLLLPNLDKVFDLGYISFLENGGILISSELESANLLGINTEMRLKVKKNNKPYLDYHRENIFKN